MSLTPRQGVLSRVYKIKEVDGSGVNTWGTDPVTPIKNLVPLFGEDGVHNTQPRNPATIYDGVRSSKGSWKGMIDASGAMPTSLDFRYAGVDLDCHFGHSVYIRTGGRHRWVGQGDPIPYQIQEEHTQPTAIIHRNKGFISRILTFPTQVEGQSMYTVDQLGNGDEVYTDVGGTEVTYQPFTAFNYFDGAILLNGVSKGNITSFSLAIDNKVTRVDAAFHSGLSAGYNLGLPVITGDFEALFTVEDGDTFYNLALNDTICEIVCYYLNKPVVGGPTMWLRFKMPAVLFSRMSTGAGGDQAMRQRQTFTAQVPAADNPALAWGTTVGPWVFTGANNVSKWFIDGAGTSIGPATVGTGTLSAATVAAALNADAPFFAAALASDFNGRLQVESRSTVAAVSKVKADTVVANTAATITGFDATVWSGDAAAMIYTDLFNTVLADY